MCISQTTGARSECLDGLDRNVEKSLQVEHVIMMIMDNNKKRSPNERTGRPTQTHTHTK